MLGLLSVATPGLADQPTPFDQGRTRVSLGGGSAGGFGNRYVVLGLGVGYYVAPGLELGLDSAFWIGGDPSIIDVSPQARYVFFRVPTIKPYVGAFYRHRFIGAPYDDLASAGGRAGAFYVTGRGGFLGGGVVYEALMDCDAETEAAYGSCTDIYPELVFSLTF
jgi:hypothetical protein